MIGQFGGYFRFLLWFANMSYKLQAAYMPNHYIAVIQFQYILTISIAWEFATN